MTDNTTTVTVRPEHLDRARQATIDLSSVRNESCMFAQAIRDVLPTFRSMGYSTINDGGTLKQIVSKDRYSTYELIALFDGGSENDSAILARLPFTFTLEPRHSRA